MSKHFIFIVVISISSAMIPTHIFPRALDRPSATIEIMKVSPPMSTVQNSNILFAGGINGKYPGINEFKKLYQEKASRLIAIINELGESLDEMKTADDAFDKNIRLQFIRWHSLMSQNKLFTPIFLEEKKLMEKSVGFQIKNAIYWGTVKAYRGELSDSIKELGNIPTSSLVQSSLHLEILKLYFVLIDFYSEKQKSLFISATCLHSFEENKQYNLPGNALSRVTSLHTEELELINFMIHRLVGIWELAFSALAELEKLKNIDNKIIITAKKKLLQQYVDLQTATQELRANGFQDEADIVIEILKKYQAILLFSRETREAKRNSLSTVKMKQFFSSLHVITVAHAGVVDWVKSTASVVGDSVLFQTITGTVNDIVNIPVEAFDKTTKGIADIYFGNEKVNAQSFINGVQATYSKIGTHTLGQDAMSKAQGSFKEFDKEFIDTIPLGQALANVATFGGYGLAKDVVTLNDDNASFTDKIVASVGVGLSFIPLQAPSGNVATGALGGTVEATKSGLKSSTKITLKANKFFWKSGANSVAKNEAYIISKELIKAQKAKAGKSLIWQLEKKLFKATAKTGSTLTHLITTQKNLKQSIKDGIKSTLNSLVNGVKKGFVGENETAMKTIGNAMKGNWGKSVTEGIHEIVEGGVKKFILQGVTTELAGDSIKNYVKDTINETLMSDMMTSAQIGSVKGGAINAESKIKKEKDTNGEYDPHKDPGANFSTDSAAIAQAETIGKDFQKAMPGGQNSNGTGGSQGSGGGSPQPPGYTKNTIGGNINAATGAGGTVGGGAGTGIPPIPPPLPPPGGANTGSGTGGPTVGPPPIPPPGGTNTGGKTTGGGTGNVGGGAAGSTQGGKQQCSKNEMCSVLPDAAQLGISGGAVSPCSRQSGTKTTFTKLLPPKGGSRGVNMTMAVHPTTAAAKAEVQKYGASCGSGCVPVNIGSGGYKTSSNSYPYYQIYYNNVVITYSSHKATRKPIPPQDQYISNIVQKINALSCQPSP